MVGSFLMSFFLSECVNKYIAGVYCGGVPPLPIPNRAVKPACADGTARQCGRVGGCPFFQRGGRLKGCPLFFVENQTYGGIENPHNDLTPRLSKMVITAHTRDGIDLAKNYGIPPIIQNFISQHHGESLAGYFYTQAVQQEGKENVSEEQFRYTGPKPNTKETAILMIADSVESASRTLKDFSEESVEKMINKIITDKLNDGQLSDSPLSLKDIQTIAQTLNKSLRAAHHQRIKYNDIEELKNIGNRTPDKNKIAEPNKLMGTELQDKIDKKIEKKKAEKERQSNDNNP